MHTPIVAFDFDGVIATYNGWKGVDVLGKPIPKTIKAIQLLKKKGYQIIIFTTRKNSPTLREWLKDNNVPYDAINKHIERLPNTSVKPLYQCIVDDRSVNFNLKSNDLSVDELIAQVEQRIEEAK